MVGSPHTETEKHLKAFEEWYESGRAFLKVAKSGRSRERTLRNWAERFHWHARADLRDQEAAKIADADAIARRAEMLKRHRQAGELLVRRGIEFHAKSAIGKAQDATAAISKGIEIERTAEGLPGWVLGILNADEVEIERIISELDARRRAATGDGPSEETGTPPEWFTAAFEEDTADAAE